MELFSWVTDPSAWVALATLSILEIVLGIDNIVFLALVVSRLPKELQAKARVFGLSFAMITRIALLSLMFVLAHLQKPLFEIGDFAVSGRDMVLFLGGLFLMYKSVREIHEMATPSAKESDKKISSALWLVVLQIGVLDIVFSLDSVITAVGMAENLIVMILAIMLAVGVMLAFSKSVTEFVDKHKSVKILALAFLMLVGTALVADALHFHIPKGYLYFAIAFSLGVEGVNIWLGRNDKTESNISESNKEQK